MVKPFLNKISQIPKLAFNFSIAKNGLQLLILLPPFLESWDYTTILASCGDCD